MKTFNEIKKESLELLKENWREFVLINLFPLILVLIVNIPAFFIFYQSDFHTSKELIPFFVVYYVLIAIFFFVYPVFHMAIVQEIVNLVKNGTKPTVKGMFKNFRLTGKAIGAFWWTYLWLYLWTLAYMVPFAVFCVIGAAFIGTENTSLIVLGIIFMILGIISYFVLIVFFVRKAIEYSMIDYAITDDNSKGPITGLNESKRVTKGKIGKIFGFEMSFIGWCLLCILTCGIGFLWLNTYFQTAGFLMYKDLSTGNLPSPEVKPELNAPSAESETSAVDDDPYFAKKL